MTTNANRTISDLRHEGLVDIAAIGRARQSSLSRWSKENDAQRAVNGTGGSFAFHTGAEKAPWWELTFEPPRRASHVALENRRSPDLRYRADRLTIDVEDAEGRVHQAYTGQRRFGTEADGDPLIVPLDLSAPLRRVRITAHTGGEPFHLSRVAVLSERERPASALPLVIANRRDGFGERLKAILNAMVIAQALPGRFRFGWLSGWRHLEEWHSIHSVEDTFDAAFVEEHFMSAREISDLHTLPISAAGSAAAKPDGYIVTQGTLGSQAPGLFELDGNFSRIQPCFEQIKFAPPLEKVRELARSIPLEAASTVALHLRAGDIIYGPYRKTGLFHRKACPYPIAEEIAADTKRQGRSLVVFGQDERLIQYFADRYGATSARAIAEDHELDRMQQALFDLCLMARCGTIVSGTSGFAVLATWISGRKGVHPYRYFDAARTQEILETAALGERSDERISPLQKAFACWAAFNFNGRIIAEGETSMRILHQAIQHDPDNDLFRLATACSLIASGGFQAGERILAERLQQCDSKQALRKTLDSKDATGQPVLREYIPYLDVAAEKDCPSAAWCLAVLQSHMEGEQA